MCFLLFYRAEDDGRRKVFQSAQEHARWAAVPARIFHGSAEFTDCRGRDAGQRLPGRLHPWHTASQKEEQHCFPCEAMGDEWKRGISSSPVPRPISPATVTADTQHYWRTSGILLKQEWQHYFQVNSISIYTPVISQWFKHNKALQPHQKPYNLCCELKSTQLLRCCYFMESSVPVAPSDKWEVLTVTCRMVKNTLPIHEIMYCSSASPQLRVTLLY